MFGSFLSDTVDLVFCCVHCVPSKTWARLLLRWSCDVCHLHIVRDCEVLFVADLITFSTSHPQWRHLCSDRHILISDDMHSISLVLTFGTVRCRLYSPSPHILHSVEHWKLTFINFHFFPAYILFIVLCIDYVRHSRSIIVQMCAINVLCNVI